MLRDLQTKFEMDRDIARLRDEVCERESYSDHPEKKGVLRGNTSIKHKQPKM